ncbi:MAG: class I SAM-dependent methyltransferase [Chthoniobacterales bacterium]
MLIPQSFRKKLSAFWEDVLLRQLELHFRRKYSRTWRRGAEAPHFFDQRTTFFHLGYGSETRPLYCLARAFYTAEILRKEDVVLDIGCGDGFFSSRFYAPLCAHVDAIDIELSPLSNGKYKQSVSNLRYRQQDAVNDPFPESSYDVIAWDGALGHFAPDTTAKMMKKIAAALKPDGIFVGSESLGKEGSDHLQFFNSAAELEVVMAPYFRYAFSKTLDYVIPGGIRRRETYWRCSQTLERLDEVAWSTSVENSET